MVIGLVVLASRVAAAFLEISRARRSQSNASGRPVTWLGTVGFLSEVRVVRKIEVIWPETAFEKFIRISSRDMAFGLSDLLASLKEMKNIDQMGVYNSNGCLNIKIGIVFVFVAIRSLSSPERTCMSASTLSGIAFLSEESTTQMIASVAAVYNLMSP